MAATGGQRIQTFVCSVKGFAGGLRHYEHEDANCNPTKSHNQDADLPAPTALLEGFVGLWHRMRAAFHSFDKHFRWAGSKLTTLRPFP
jgi:hypothetical protein